MSCQEENLAAERHKMVRQQLLARGISEPIARVFEDIPREKFVPQELIARAYEDGPLAIGFGQTISQPYVVALMVQELDADRRHRVLDVGSGSGYQSAILSRLLEKVHAVERYEQLLHKAQAAWAELGITNIDSSVADGSLGWPERAPFDRIICAAAGPEIPPAWIEQLAESGRIVAPLGRGDSQTLVVADKSQAKLRQRELCAVRFVKLIGRQGWPT